jgi:hypothetical protein
VKRILIPALVALLAAGCGDDDEPTGPGAASNHMSATIDGQNWESDQSTITVTGSAAIERQGTISISGKRLSNNKSVTLLLSFISGPGTYPLGVSVLSNAGGTGLVSDPPNSWLTPLNGEAGSVTITTRTDTRIAGSFEFDATELPGTAAGTARVRNGEFDITVDGGLPDLPTGFGSSMSANLEGDFWNAAEFPTANSPSFAAFDLKGKETEFLISIVPKVPVEAGQTYGIPFQIDFKITRLGGSEDVWHSEGGPNTGTVTITALTNDNLVGTFQGSIPQETGGIEPMLVEDGQFNVYLAPIEIKGGP